MKTINWYSFTAKELITKEKEDDRKVDYKENHMKWNEIWDRDIWTQTDEDREMAREERFYY